MFEPRQGPIYYIAQQNGQLSIFFRSLDGRLGFSLEFIFVTVYSKTSHIITVAFSCLRTDKFLFDWLYPFFLTFFMASLKTSL